MNQKSGLKILVVEDEKIAWNFLVTNLKELGHQVETVVNDCEALTVLETAKPDMVFIDLYLPEINGLQLISRLNSSYPQLPLIAISSTDKIDDAVQSIRLGAWDFLKKSELKIDDIYDAITRCIIRHQKRIDNIELYNLNKKRELLFLENNIDFLPFGFFIKDKNNNFKLVNKTFSDFFGISQDQIKKIKSSELYNFININSKHYINILNENDKKLLTGEKKWVKGELYFVDKAGTPVWLHIFKVAFKLSKKETEIVGYAIDLSEQKILEERLHKLKDKAEIANEAKSLFIANMSHELRTPLNGVMGMIQLVLDEEDLSKTNREMLEISRQSAQKLLHIVNSILEVSRLESEDIEFHPEEFGLSRRLHKIIDEFYTPAKEKGLSLTADLEEDLPHTCFCDHVYLRQIFRALLSNALNFTPKGSIQVKVSNDFERQGILFEVKDTGIGIPPEKQDIIFEKFTLAEDILTKRYGGIGIGLALCKRILSKMDGEIWVKSEVNKGSKFSFFIPFKSLGASCIIPISKNNVKNRSLSILFAEDDSSNLIYGQRLLEKIGHEVQLATNGEQALRLLRNNSFDLAIIDFKMPKKNGYEVLSQIRAGKAGNRNIPVIMATAHLQDKYRQIIFQSGADSYLQKPYSSGELYRRINKIIYKYNLVPR